MKISPGFFHLAAIPLLAILAFHAPGRQGSDARAARKDSAVPANGYPGSGFSGGPEGAGGATGPIKTIQVKTSKNIELFGLILQLDMGPDLINSKDSVLIEGRQSTWRDWYLLAYKNYLRYKSFDSCAMMQIYRGLAAKNFYNDFFVELMEQVDEVPFAKITAQTDREVILPFSPKGDLEEAKQKATAFLDELNHFYKMVDFGAFLQENKDYYAIAISDVKKNLPDSLFITVMENFYQKSFHAYCLIPSLNLPTSMGFGKMSRTTRTIYNAFGPFSFQSFDKQHPNMGFDYPDRIRQLSVHEFGHSFVNPAVDRLPKDLVASTEYLYLPIKEEMSKHAYTSWTMCLYEHFVKAGEVMIARKLGHSGEAEEKMRDNGKTAFIYLPFIVKELEEYDKNRGQKTSYADFVETTVRRLKSAYPQ